MKIFATFLALLLTSIVSATTLNKIVVFGDSLSDNGNLYEYMKHQMPVSPPYFQGRFTNGPIWVEALLKKYYGNAADEHLLDYAFGGAGVAGENDDNNDDDGLFTLHHEVDSYLLAHQDKADDRSLYVLWMGSNNYLSLPDDIDQMVTDVNWGIKNSIERLIQKGAKHFLIIGIPDLGKTPNARDFDAVPILNYASVQHNNRLKSEFSKFKQTYPTVQWLFFDAFEVLNEVLQNPLSYGFTNVVDTCYEAQVDEHPSSQSILKMVATIRKPLGKDACEGFLFFDPVHPSASAHSIMANRLFRQFTDSKIEFK